MWPTEEASPNLEINPVEITALKKQISASLEVKSPNSAELFSRVRKLNRAARKTSGEESEHIDIFLGAVGDEDYRIKAGLVREVYILTLDASQADRNGVLEAISLFNTLGYSKSGPVEAVIKQLTTQFDINPNEKYTPPEPTKLRPNPFKGLKTKVALALGAASSLLIDSNSQPVNIANPEPRAPIASASELRLEESSATPIKTSTTTTLHTFRPTLTPSPSATTPTKKVSEKEASLPTNLFTEVIFPRLLDIAEKKRAKIAKNPELTASLNPELKNQVNLILLGIGSDDAFTDSIIILSFNKQSGEMSMVNLPRDMQDPRVWAATKSVNNSRINQAYITGGLPMIEQAITDATGLSPDASLVLNYKMIDQVVDAMGGLDITLAEAVDDPNIHLYPNGLDQQGVPLHFGAGSHKLTGFETRRLIQSRRGTLTSITGEVKDSTDYVRAGRQQEVLKAMLVQFQKMLKTDPLKFMQTVNKLRDFVSEGYNTGKIDTDFNPNDLLPQLFDPNNISNLLGFLSSGKFDLGIPLPKNQIVVGQDNVIVGNVQPNSGDWVSGTGKDINSPPLEYYSQVRDFTQRALEKPPQAPKVVFVPGYMQKGDNNLGVSMAEVGAGERPDPKVYMAKLKESIIKDASVGSVNLVGFSMGGGALEMFFESGEYDSLPQNIKDNIKGIVLINARDLTRTDTWRLPKGLQPFYSKLNNLEKMRNSGKPIKVIISKDDEQVLRPEGVHLAQLLGVLPVLVEGNHFTPVNSPETLANIVNN